MYLFKLLSFTSLTTRQVFNLKRMIQFNYKPYSIIITIFQTESFHLLIWKVSRLKCISLIKLTSIRNTLFLLEWNVFDWEKGWNEWERQCTKKCSKSSFIILIFKSVISLLFCFISLLFDYQRKSRISSLLKPFFKFFMFLLYFIKIN